MDERQRLEAALDAAEQAERAASTRLENAGAHRDELMLTDGFEAADQEWQAAREWLREAAAECDRLETALQALT